MKRTISVASGKGGAGKTTVATNLARVAGEGVRLLDCDVEAPNCHLFMNATIESTDTANVMVPVVDEDKCIACGKCGEVCQYSAIVALKTKPIVFPELCHGCYGCVYVCPVDAISAGSRAIGVVETGRSGAVEFVHGRLNVGEPMAPPLIRQVRRHERDDGLNLIDAPPGASCPAMESVRASDYVVMAAESTPFGLHDLRLAIDMLRRVGLRFGVVINRVGLGDGRTREYCDSQGVTVLAEIPDDRRVAEAYSEGRLAVDAVPGMAERFGELLEKIEREAQS